MITTTLAQSAIEHVGESDSCQHASNRPVRSRDRYKIQKDKRVMGITQGSRIFERTCWDASMTDPQRWQCPAFSRAPQFLIRPAVTLELVTQTCHRAHLRTLLSQPDAVDTLQLRADQVSPVLRVVSFKVNVGTLGQVVVSH